MGKENTSREREKCFVIMPISDQGDYPKGHFEKVYRQIFVPAIEDAGYEAFRVDEDNMCTQIVEKIFKAIQDCPMALCDLSNRNPNVLYELGIRQAYDKPVVLVQDEKTERIFDVSGINTIAYRSSRLYEEVLEAREKITNAIKSTRDGGQTSIIKVLKAQAASTASEEISKEDKIEILLSGLVKDVNDLKNQNRHSMREPIYYDDLGDSRKIYVKEDKDSEAAVCFITLKSDITNDDIKDAVSRVARRYDVEINYAVNNEVLRVWVESDNARKKRSIYNDLKNRLSDRT